MQVRHCPATVNVSDFSKTTVKRWEGKRSVDHKSGDLPIASTPETLRGIGGGMLTKQNVLFVTVRQTPKWLYEGKRSRPDLHTFGVYLTIVDELDNYRCSRHLKTDSL